MGQHFNFSLTWNNQNTIEFPELISHAPAGGFESVVHSMTKYFVTYFVTVLQGSADFGRSRGLLTPQHFCSLPGLRFPNIAVQQSKNSDELMLKSPNPISEGLIFKIFWGEHVP